MKLQEKVSESSVSCLAPQKVSAVSPTKQSRKAQQLSTRASNKPADISSRNAKRQHGQTPALESGAGYKALYDGATIGYVTVDRRGKIVESNRAAAALLGIEGSLLPPVHLSKFIGREFRHKWSALRRAMFSGRARTSDVEMLGGHDRAIRVRIESTVFGSGARRRCHLALTEIRSPRGAEAALRELNEGSEWSFRLSGPVTQGSEAGHPGEAVLISRGANWSEAKIIFVNQAVCRLTGYTEAELIGRSWVPPQATQTQRTTINRIRGELSAGRPCHVDIVQYRKDGGQQKSAAFITPVSDERGRFTTFVCAYGDGSKQERFVGAVVDISGQKQTQLELERHRKDLRIMASELMLAQEGERRRLAEILHDGLSQALFRARMKVDQLSLVRPEAKEISGILEEMGKMISAVTFELSPIVLRTLGLRHAIRSLISDMFQRYSLSVTMDDDEREIVTDERVSLVLFRSVREILVNVAKHAQTDRAHIELKRIERAVQIRIIDRGRGFDTDEQSNHVESGHFGLFSIRERLEYLGGTFSIRSAPGKGTLVVLDAPLMKRKLALQA